MTKPTRTLPTTGRADIHIATVNAHELQVNPVAQREFRPAWAARILAEWDDRKFQLPHVNRRADGSLYVMEGQHTVWAYREHFGAEGEAYLPIQAWVYDGLDEQGEAELFLSLNNKKAVDAMARFKVGVTAGRPIESDIDRVVRANGGVVTSYTHTPGAISAVGAVQSIYNGHGADHLGTVVRVLRDSFGDGGYERANLLGVSAVLARYGVPEAELVRSLVAIPRGSKGLAQRANLLRESFGATIVEATAAAIVDAYNKGRRGRAVLPNWWRAEAAA